MCAYGATELFFATGTTGVKHGYTNVQTRRSSDGSTEHLNVQTHGVNSKEYRDILLGTGPYDGGLLKQGAALFAEAGVANWAFMQDNARIHYAGSNTANGNETRAAIDSVAPEFVDDWPAKASDLNVIENVWRNTDWDLWANHEWSDFAGYKVALRSAWKRQTTPEKMKRLCGSFRKRLLACIAAQGGETKY